MPVLPGSALLEQIVGTVSEFFVLCIPFLLVTSGVAWDQDGFDIVVQLVEQDIRKDWAGNRSLWNSAEGSVKFPILKISGVKEFLDEVNETSLLDVFFHPPNNHLVIESVEPLRNVALDHPDGSSPVLVQFSDRVYPSA